MLKMVDVEFIKKKEANGWSIRKIARQLDASGTDGSQKKGSLEGEQRE